MRPLVITGTDTGVGKTVVAAMLTLALDAIYWKPIQSGTADGTDTKTVRGLTGLDSSHFRPERYVLRDPLSPHQAAARDGVDILVDGFDLPMDVPAERWLVIEGAGGLLVPISPTALQTDLFARWGAPLVLCARTALGTINHTLLSIEAAKRRGLTLLGILFVGEAMPETETIIAKFGGAKRLGRLPLLKRLDGAALRHAFEAGFDRKDFETALRRSGA